MLLELLPPAMALKPDEKVRLFEKSKILKQTLNSSLVKKGGVKERKEVNTIKIIWFKGWRSKDNGKKKCAYFGTATV